MRSSLKRIALVLAGATALVLTLLAPAPAGADPGTVLIYGPSMTTSTPNEQTVAEAAGHTVTVVDATQWEGMTTEEFAAFNALVIGDGGCDAPPSLLDAAVNSRTTWSPAVTGHITLNTFDIFFHNQGQGAEFFANSINFAAGGTGTGLYFSLSCWFGGGDLTILDQFGTFTTDGDSGNEVDFLQPTHPVLAGITNFGLEDWGSSFHNHFVSFPGTFQALLEDADGNPDLPVLLANPGVPSPPAPVPTPVPSPPICKGKTATVFGSSSGEVLTGTPANDVIAGLGGNDRINAGAGKDLVCGGDGNDTLKGGAGKDTLLGQGGKDLLAGGAGTGDVCKGGAGKDTAKRSCEKGKA
jgi:hypothetical protein